MVNMAPPVCAVGCLNTTTTRDVANDHRHAHYPFRLWPLATQRSSRKSLEDCFCTAHRRTWITPCRGQSHSTTRSSPSRVPQTSPDGVDLLRSLVFPRRTGCDSRRVCPTSSRTPTHELCVRHFARSHSSSGPPTFSERQEDSCPAQRVCQRSRETLWSFYPRNIPFSTRVRRLFSKALRRWCMSARDISWTISRNTIYLRNNTNLSAITTVGNKDILLYTTPYSANRQSPIHLYYEITCPTNP